MSLEVKQPPSENEKISDLFSKTIKNTSSTFILSIFSKVVNLSCNIVLLRQITKEAYGIVKTLFEFAFLMVAFFPRETLRKTAQKFCTSQNADEEKKKYVLACQLYSLVVAAVLTISWLLYLVYITINYNISWEIKVQLLIYIISAIVELFSEPVIIYMNLHIENKQIAITIGNFTRVISNVVFAAYFGWDAWSFTLSRALGSTLYVTYLMTIGLYKFKINYFDFIRGSYRDLITKKEVNGVNVETLREILVTFIKATFLKMVWSHCEKLILNFVLNQSNEEKGEYFFIIENFGFLVRFLIEPFEETFYNLINKIKNLNAKVSQHETFLRCYKVLKMFLRVVLILGTLLICYFYLVGIELFEWVYTSKWSSGSTKKIGMVYSVYIAIICNNGIIEAFANATNSAKQMGKSNILMIINTSILVTLLYTLSKWDICGWIIANGIVMIIRIYGNLYIIFACREEETNSKKDIESPSKGGVEVITHLMQFFNDYYMSPNSVAMTISLVLCGHYTKYLIAGSKLIVQVGLLGSFAALNGVGIYYFEKERFALAYKAIKNNGLN